MRSLIQTICIAVLLLTTLTPKTGHASATAEGVTEIAVVPEGDRVTVAEVAAILERNESVLIFDANSRESYLQAHIPGARWIQYDAVTSVELPESKDAKLIFYCFNPLCAASPIAAKKALSLGYRNVWLMPEGIEGWRKANFPVTAGAAAN